MPSSTPSALGKYEILAEIGRGGFATVYRARDLDLSRDVALKVLDPLLVRDPVWVARFRREARAVAGLDHPRIVTIYEIGQAEGALYIAMKLLEGGSLAQRLAQLGPLPWPEVFRITGEIAEALDYAHGQGVLHRDLKPGNVLLDPRNGAVLTDFGFARLVADNSLSISMSGGLVGTPAYIAPEIWEGQDATAQTDIYALGCILFELVTGRTLFTGATPPAIMMAHFQSHPLPESWPEGTPPGMDQVLAIALARDPAARYATAGDLAAAVAALSIDPLAEPNAALEVAIASGAWQPGLALAAEIRAQRTDYRDVVALEQRALSGAAQAAREQQAAQWRQAAEEALAAGRLENAELAAKQWQQLVTNDPAFAVFARQLEQAKLNREAATGRDQAEQAPGAVSTPARQSRWTSRLLALMGLLAVVVVLIVATLNSDGAGRPILTAPGATVVPATDSLPVPMPHTATSVPPTNTTVALTNTLVPSSDTPTPALGIGSTLMSKKDNMELIYVPAGEFTMGSPEGQGGSDERPQHTVYLDAYWIDKTEVTNAQFARFVDETDHQTDAEKAGSGWIFDSTAKSWSETQGANWRHPRGPESNLDGLAEHPVVLVSWNDAAAYCAWTGKRLPSEAEWEKAARDADGRTYPWGEQTPTGDLLNFVDHNLDLDGADRNVDDGYQFTAPVGSYPAGMSPYGALDMAGNVWEWVADWYESAYYTSSPRENPQGAASGTERVLRGGSWYIYANFVRAANRYGFSPDNHLVDIGFRCARSP